MQKQFVDSVQVRMGGKDWWLPPLSFGQIRQYLPALGEMDLNKISTWNEAQLDLIVDFVHAALSRNYPELTREEVFDLVDCGNIQTVMSAVWGKSGLVAVGEA